jgi:LmbE family N-acetylglucosaminyl deacetylase
VTDGRNGTADPSVSSEEITKIRRVEVQEAGKVLGVSDFVFLDYPDGGYSSESALCKSIVAVIRRVRPVFVLTVDPFLPYEAHPDHRSVGMAAAQACMFASLPHFIGDGESDPAPIWQVKNIAFHSSAYPNTFINVDETWALREKGILSHQSQFTPQSYQFLGRYFDLKARQYAFNGCTHAEAFKVLPMELLHMSVDTLHM